MAVIVTVLLVAVVLVIGVLGYHSMFVKSNAQVQRKANTIPVYTNDGMKPGTSLDKTAGSSGTPASTSTDTTILMGELNQTTDDGGVSDFQVLEQQAAQL